MVDGTCLENKRASDGTAGSNPVLSAIEKDDHLVVFFYAVNKDPNLRLLAKQEDTAGSAQRMKQKKASAVQRIFSFVSERRSEVKRSAILFSPPFLRLHQKHRSIISIHHPSPSLRPEAVQELFVLLFPRDQRAADRIFLELGTTHGIIFRNCHIFV